MIVDTHVLAVRQETPIDRTLRLAIPPEARAAFVFVPGQFVVLHDPRAEQPRRRAYSISSPPGDEQALEVTVRDMGTFGHTLYDLPEGAPLAMRSPAGRFILQAEAGEDLLLVAGGSGVTPFRSFVLDLHQRAAPTRVTLLQSARHADQLVFHATFAALAATHPPFTYVPTVTRPREDGDWAGRCGRIDAELMRAHAGDPERVRFYACGPAAFVRDALAHAEALGIPPERRHREQWG